MKLLMLLLWCGLTYYNFNNYAKSEEKGALFLTGFCSMGLLDSFLKLFL
jgi:hypothetical protein